MAVAAGGVAADRKRLSARDVAANESGCWRASGEGHEPLGWALPWHETAPVGTYQPKHHLQRRRDCGRNLFITSAQSFSLLTSA